MKFLGWVVALPFIALALFIVARFVMYRPDGEVVRVATPMVEKIADYIVEHGVPESLAEIPGLPYELEGCEGKIDYTNKRKPVNTIEKATTGNIYQKCIFKKDYTVSLHFTFFYKEKDCTGSLKIENKYSETVGITSYSCKNQSIIEKKTIFGSGKISGVCSPMKQ